MKGKRQRVIIMGAGGRDFHLFNTCFCDHDEYEVIAFTATQIPGIANRCYPQTLAGKLYPEGIPIHPEEELNDLIQEFDIDLVVFGYSDVSHQFVMEKASQVLAAGPDFKLVGVGATMLKSSCPVIAVSAVRTGCGKSQTARKIARLMVESGKQAVAVRHPMPYGDLAKQVTQRFSRTEDLLEQECTIEEMEEYEPYLELGIPVYSGVDYQNILDHAEKEADIIIWDGGNNDVPFYQPDLEIVVVDPHRVGDELSYFPGKVNLLRADVVVINKMDSAEPAKVKTLLENIEKVNSRAQVINAESPVVVDHPEMITGKKVLVIEDGPTLTHGGMKFGAGTLAAKQFGAEQIMDPRPWLKGSLEKTFRDYPDVGPLLPAMGYGEKQCADLQATIEAVPCDLVVIGTPIDLGRVIEINKPSVRVRYELQETGEIDLRKVLESHADKLEY